MRNEEEVKKMMDRYQNLKMKRREEIIENLSEKIFKRFEKLLDKNIPIDCIVFEENSYTKCIDVTFVSVEYENLVKLIENSELLKMSTNIKYFELIIEFWHEKMRALEFLEDDIWSGAYNEKLVSFVVKQ